RREGPELFAKLDVAVEPIARLARVRRRQDAAMAERAWSELACALHPPDDASRGELVGHALDERRLVQLVDRLAVLARRAREVAGAHRRAPERMIGAIAGGIA